MAEDSQGQGASIETTVLIKNTQPVGVSFDEKTGNATTRSNVLRPPEPSQPGATEPATQDSPATVVSGRHLECLGSSPDGAPAGVDAAASTGPASADMNVPTLQQAVGPAATVGQENVEARRRDESPESNAGQGRVVEAAPHQDEAQGLQAGAPVAGGRNIVFAAGGNTANEAEPTQERAFVAGLPVVRRSADAMGADSSHYIADGYGLGNAAIPGGAAPAGRRLAYADDAGASGPSVSGGSSGPAPAALSASLIGLFISAEAMERMDEEQERARKIGLQLDVLANRLKKE